MSSLFFQTTRGSFSRSWSVGCRRTRDGGRGGRGRDTPVSPAPPGGGGVPARALYHALAQHLRHLIHYAVAPIVLHCPPQCHHVRGLFVAAASAGGGGAGAIPPRVGSRCPYRGLWLVGKGSATRAPGNGQTPGGSKPTTARHPRPTQPADRSPGRGSSHRPPPGIAPPPPSRSVAQVLPLFVPQLHHFLAERSAPPPHPPHPNRFYCCTFGTGFAFDFSSDPWEYLD